MQSKTPMDPFNVFAVLFCAVALDGRGNHACGGCFLFVVFVCRGGGVRGRMHIGSNTKNRGVLGLALRMVFLFDKHEACVVKKDFRI